MYKRLMLVLLSVLSFCSCKKETDTLAPQVVISMPYENQLFNVGETVNVITNVCDDRQLDYVSLKLLNENYAAVAAPATFYPENNCDEISHGILIDNLMLPSGTYYILVSASDGAHITNEFRKIKIRQLEKKLKFVMVLTKNGNHIDINQIDSLNNITFINSLVTDYCGSAVSSDAQQFYIAGRSTGDISVYCISDWQLQWNVPVIVSPPFPYFAAVDVHDSRLYVSFREGRFAIYDVTGNIIASRMIENAEYPLAFLPYDDYLVTYEVSPDGIHKHLVAYFRNSLSIYKKIQINYQIQKILPSDDDECLLFCNNQGQGMIKLFSLATGMVTDKYVFVNGTFADAAGLETSGYLFLSGNDVWYFGYDEVSCIQWTNALNPRCLMYDETEGCYYFAENYFTVRKNRFWPNGTLHSFDFQDTVIDILPVYNRD